MVFIIFKFWYNKIMETFKFTLFSIVVLSLLTFVGYWGFSSIESGSSHLDNEQFKQYKDENDNLKDKVANLTNEISSLTSKMEEKNQILDNLELEIKENTNSTETVSLKYQSLITLLQKLITDNISMKKGSLGTRVGTVQKFLNLYNKTTNKIDNAYGPTMVSRIKAFQKSQGLTSDGEAGPNTYSKMITWLKKQG